MSITIKIRENDKYSSVDYWNSRYSTEEEYDWLGKSPYFYFFMTDIPERYFLFRGLQHFQRSHKETCKQTRQNPHGWLWKFKTKVRPCVCDQNYINYFGNIQIWILLLFQSTNV